MPSDTVLDHVAIAVSSLDNAKKVYEDLGLKFSLNIEVVESQKVKTLFAELGKDKSAGHLELLGPIGNDGPIYNFIQKNGEGIHHLAFLVKDITQLSLDLKAKGYRLLYENPVAGAGGKLVNFIHPKSTGGVLIEICQCQKNK